MSRGLWNSTALLETTLPPISFKAAAHGSGSAVSRPQRLQGLHTSEPPREAAGLCSISVVSDPQVKQVNFPPALPCPFCALAAGSRGNAVKAGSSQSTAHSRASHGRLGEALWGGGWFGLGRRQGLPLSKLPGVRAAFPAPFEL